LAYTIEVTDRAYWYGSTGNRHRYLQTRFRRVTELSLHHRARAFR
jgi:hypothetical protein